MVADTKLTFDIFAYDRASGTFHKVGNASESAGHKVSAIGTKLRSFAKAAAFAGIAAAGFAVKLGVDAIGAASDLNETLSKSKVIFGDAQKQVEKFADGAAKNLGQSKQQALDAAQAHGRAEIGTALHRLTQTLDEGRDPGPYPAQFVGDVGAYLKRRYVDNTGAIATRYPFNPNGSPGGLTSVTTDDGRFTVLMPHPERVFRQVQMSWQGGDVSARSPWMRMFQNARRALG